MTDWRDHDQWWAGKGSTANDIWHLNPDCPRLKSDTERTRNWMAYHDPRPCEVCDPEQEVEAGRASCMKVIGDLEVGVHE